MNSVLAALDTSAAARPVLETALGIGELTAHNVTAVHVGADSAATPQALADDHSIPLRVVDGPVDASLLAALAEPDVVAGVFGARGTRSGARPAGQTAMKLLEEASKPVVVVPPDVVAGSRRRFRRVLLPLEGSEASAQPVAHGFVPLIAEGVELVVVHVFTEETALPMLDHPARDLQIWGDEFAARFCPHAARIELRTGAVGTSVTDVCSETDADLIVLAWSQNFSAGHATVVRNVLDDATVPVLLLPVAGAAPVGAGNGAADRSR